MNDEILNLKVKIFADGANITDILEMYRNPLIKGLTTNPTLMRSAGIKDYSGFAREVLSVVKDKSISFEVFSDDLNEMETQAKRIATWGENVYVKIPITNTKGVSTQNLIRTLVQDKIKVNVTAIMTLEQVKLTAVSLNPEVPSYVSIFAGRIADTGRDPIKIIDEAIKILEPIKSAELIWASPRELLNIFQASNIGCHIITATTDILKKLKLVGYDLNEYSLDTVKMFHEDAKESGFEIHQ
jgi:transaldolase